MIIYPAVDIRGGKAVQLVEGDFNHELAFDADPVDAAKRWEDLGADWIHIVDLDGARDGRRANAATIQRIRDAVTVRIELGGGLRTIDDLDEVHAMGIDRLIIGSAAITTPDFIGEAIDRFGEAVAVGLDARDGLIATHAWVEQTDRSAVEAARAFAELGVQHIIFTDIRRDGRMRGPNLDALVAMIAAVSTNVIASGGISTIHDVEAVKRTGAAGVIIGTALYTDRVSLDQALAIGRGSATGTDT